MPNPIYILQLSDWHYIDDKIAKYYKDHTDFLSEKVKLLELGSSELKKTISLFLKEKERKKLDIICLTGDMFDKNGDDKDGNNITNYDSVAKVVNDISDTFLCDKKRYLFSTPGNHDLNQKKSFDILIENELAKCILSNPLIPNYHVVDKFNEKLEGSFDKYIEFLNEINATNKDEPFSGHKILDFNHSKLFLSWFNSSWLSIGKNHAEFHKKIMPQDYENLSLGNKVNKKTNKAFKRFKKQTKNSKLFTLSISHHYPRLLNLFDKSDVEFSEKIQNPVLREECKELLVANSINFQKTKEKKCNYTKLDKYDLVLNGHTHGKLYDKPFSTASGGAGIKIPRLVKEEVFIYEIDFVKNCIIQYILPLKNKENESLKYKQKLYTFNDGKFIDEIKSKYNNESLYLDLKHNDPLFKEVEVNQDVEMTLKDLDLFNNTNDEISKRILSVGLDKKHLINDPFVLKNTKNEYLALKKRCMIIKKYLPKD